MCRVAVTRTPRIRNSEVVQETEANSQPFEQLQFAPEIKAEYDFSNFFADDEIDIDEDLNFLAMFNREQSSEIPAAATAPPLEPTPVCTLGQPVQVSSAHQQLAYPPIVPQIPIGQPVQQPAIATRMMEPIMAAPPALPSGSALQQQYTQAILQQHMMARMQASVGVHHSSAPMVSKRGKSAEEVAEQQERTKRRRRESAQRSRQRKSAYMKNLENENYALKLENDKLRKELMKLTGASMTVLPKNTVLMPGALITSGSSSGLVDQSSSKLPTTGTSSAAYPAIYSGDMPGLGTAAQELMGMVL